MAGNFKPSDDILISSKKESTKVNFISGLDTSKGEGRGIWRNAFDGKPTGLYMGGHKLKIEFLEPVNIYGISNGDGYETFDSNASLYDINGNSLNDKYKVYDNYIGKTWKLMFKNVPKGTYLLGSDLSVLDFNCLISELFIESDDCSVLIKENDKLYLIDEANYNTTTKTYNEIVIEDGKTIIDVLEDNLTTLGDLFNEVTIGEETFKPIDKFNNFQLITLKEAKYNLNAIKYKRGMSIANGDFSLRLAKNIDFFDSEFTIETDCSIKVALSKDSGFTWLTTSDNGITWNVLTNTVPMKAYSELTDNEKTQWDNLMDEISTNGINLSDLKNIDFNTLDADKLRFAYVFDINSASDVNTITKLQWQFDSIGDYEQMNNETDVNINISNNAIKIKPLKDIELMKVNIGSSGEVNIIQDGGTIDLPTDEEVDNMINGVMSDVFA